MLVRLQSAYALTLAELTYEQAQKALEQQERQVNELRQRTGTLLGPPR